MDNTNFIKLLDTLISNKPIINTTHIPELITYMCSNSISDARKSAVMTALLCSYMESHTPRGFGS